MSATFLVSLAGVSRPGLLQDLAHYTHEHGGKWQSSKVSHLEGHIAAIIKIEIPEEQVEAVKAQFTAQETLSVQFDDVNVPTQTPSSSLNLVVDAKDRPGLVKEITNVLDDQDVTVVDMECYRLNVTGLGSSVFSANMKLDLPEGCAQEDVMADLEDLSDDMVVKNADD